MVTTSSGSRTICCTNEWAERWRPCSASTRSMGDDRAGGDGVAGDRLG